MRTTTPLLALALAGPSMAAPHVPSTLVRAPGTLTAISHVANGDAGTLGVGWVAWDWADLPDVDTFLVRIGDDGRLGLPRVLGASTWDQPSGLVARSDGWVMAGWTGITPDQAASMRPWLVQVDPAGTVVRQLLIHGPAASYPVVAPTGDDGLLVAAAVEGIAPGPVPWIARLDASHGVTWSRTYDVEVDHVRSVTPSAGGGWAVVMTGRGFADASVLEIDAAGAPVRMRRLVVPGGTDAKAIVTARDGDLVVLGAGCAGGCDYGRDEQWFARLGTSGLVAWGGDAHAGEPLGAVEDADGTWTVLGIACDDRFQCDSRRSRVSAAAGYGSLDRDVADHSTLVPVALAGELWAHGFRGAGPELEDGWLVRLDPGARPAWCARWDDMETTPAVATASLTPLPLPATAVRPVSVVESPLPPNPRPLVTDEECTPRGRLTPPRPPRGRGGGRP